MIGTIPWNIFSIFYGIFTEEGFADSDHEKGGDISRANFE